VDEGAQGKVSAGPIVISETQITWTATDSQECTSKYQLASLSKGSTFPGGPTSSDKSDEAYTIFVLELKGPHLDSCSQKIGSFTISFASRERDFAHFTAFFSSRKAMEQRVAFPPTKHSHKSCGAVRNDIRRSDPCGLGWEHPQPFSTSGFETVYPGVRFGRRVTARKCGNTGDLTTYA
jgi:hypothetical protein